MLKFIRRPATGLAAAAIGLTGAVVATGTPSVAHAAQCTPTQTISVFSFNDFHGRVEEAAKLFTKVEEQRQSAGEDNVLLLSVGDNIGGSTFVSTVADDKPTLDVLNAIDLDATATGNHEFDKGWSDLSGRVVSDSDFPYLAANVVKKGTSEVAAPLKAYEVFEKGGVTIAVVGAVTGDLPSLVSPAGIADLEIKDPVQSVNAVAKLLKDGNPANGEADFVIAAIHEGSPDANADAESAKASPNFGAMYNNTDPAVDLILNGHTHIPYVSQTSKGQQILQTEPYGAQLVQVNLGFTADGELCNTSASAIAPAEEADASLPRIAAVQTIVEAATAAAEQKGAEKIGTATEAISTPADGGSGTRDQESPMSNLVAQMFFDKMNSGNDEFIGIQNPGGTRTSFNKGDITYEEAALVLPFANSLYTTELTGAQFKEALEQQWQLDEDGDVPSRPFLALGLSKNVSYTYDETKPQGERITGVFINGKPIDMTKKYTVGSGSFLISGGDNFRAIGEGTNTRDFGLVDLTAWVDWIKAEGTLSPDYTKRGVSVQQAPTEVIIGKKTTVTLGKPGQVSPGTLDMLLDPAGDSVSPQLPNTDVAAFIGETSVGSGSVTDGVATVTLNLPATVKEGTQLIRFVVDPSGTTVLVPVTVKSASANNTKPGLPSSGV